MHDLIIFQSNGNDDLCNVTVLVNIIFTVLVPITEPPKNKILGQRVLLFERGNSITLEGVP